ncbi:MAG: DUF2071 domain-containing protein [Pirellulaceae bacterium]|nr:DUF2071 domain-containing protein [Planctomycetales bacterium]
MTDFVSNRFRSPRHGLLGWPLDYLANADWLCAVRRAITSRLPFPVLASDIRDVVYLTWMVDVERVSPYVPDGIELWDAGGKTPFSILTYRHGCFGPVVTGPLRRLFPSPLQSNWRFYLRSVPPGVPPVNTVLFIKNVLDHALYALGSRIFSDALPSHLADRLVLERTECGYAIELESGRGSSPTLKARLEHSRERELPESFQTAFASWDAAVEYLVCQDGAVTWVEPLQRLAFSQISLPVMLETIEPLRMTPADGFHCPLLQSLGDIGPPLCFCLPAVKFRAVSDFVVRPIRTNEDVA